MPWRSNLQLIHMLSDQILLLWIKLRLGKNEDQAIVLLAKPEEETLQANLIAMAGWPRGNMRNTEDGLLAHQWEKGAEVNK